MCGDFDHDDQLDNELFSRFLAAADKLGARPGKNPEQGAMAPMDDAARSNYMDLLFQAGLVRSANDAVHIPPGERMDAVASQAIVFARLAGFLAGQLPASANLLKPAMEALLDGMNQAEEAPDDHGHHHHHGH